MKSLFKSLSKPIYLAWGQSLAVAIASLTLTLPALGEGSQQLGVGPQGLNVYLYEYDAANQFIQGTNRGIRVNVESANQVINISLCGWSYGATAEPRDDLAIEVFRPSGTEINYLTQVAVGSPGLFSATAANNRGAWLLTEGNARTATQTTLCTDRNKPSSPVGQLTNSVRFIAPEAGTYEIRLYNDTENAPSVSNVLTYFDITVTPNSSTNPNPSANNGQVWATSWAFDAGTTFALTGSYDADLYIRTPGGRPNTEFIWQLDLNKFAPFRHEIVANSIGLNAPNSRASALGASGAAYTRDFPIYLSPPNSLSSVAPILPEPAPANITNFAFADNANVDNTISPNSTTGIQDFGFFRFNTDVAGAYRITIDTNSNGTFDSSDRVLFGSATAGANSIQWDGRGINNAVLPSGTYQAGVIIGLGEYHFVTFDSETSGGGINDGLSIWKWNSLSARTPALNFWDDTKIAGNSNLVGALSDTPQGKHTWGDFTGAGIGNENFIDTWVFSSSATFQTQATITATDEDFGDAPDTGAGTGIGNYETITGDNGPRHTIVSGIRLGANIDADSGTLQNATADADDTNGTPNDEDGVTLGGNSLQNQTLNQGANATLNIATQGSGVLNAWIDWNRDGDFIDSGEQIATNTAPTNNAIALTVPVPAGASLGNTYARFRYSSQTGLGSNGAASDGEVEDYRVAIASQSTISNPLPCDGNFYQIRVTTGSQLFRINRNFNPYTQTQIGTITPQLTLNALGYNKLDGFMYAIGTGTNQLYRIGQNGAVFLGIVTGLPAADYNTATFDSAGNYYVKEGTSNNIIYRINVATRTATTVNLTQSIDLGDMAFHPTDGAIYGLRNTTLYKITLSGTTGGTVTTIGSTNIGGSPSVGSVFFDASGTLYGYENNGTFYLISTTNGNATQVSTATRSDVSDGASCPFTAPERVISTVKSVATVSRANSTTFNVPYTIVVRNIGTDAAPNTQITENLNLTFSTGTPTLTIPSSPTVTNGSCTANTSFNGTTDTKLLTGSNTLAIGSGTCTIAFTVQVAYPNLASVPSTVQNNTVYGSSTSDGPNSGYTFVSGTPIPPPALLSSSQSTIGVTYPTTNVPNLLLVKRITAVNGVDITGFQDGVNTSGNPNNVGNKAVEDNDSLWPSPNTTSLRGAINSSTIAPVVSFKPGDEVEYTIYFLNKGDSQASNVSICDFVPANQTYVGTGYNRSTFSVDTGGLAGSNYGVVIQSANGAAPVRATNAVDGDRGQFYTSGFPTSCTGTNSGRGAVVVNLGNVPNATGSGTPANSYGFIRFKAKID